MIRPTPHRPQARSGSRSRQERRRPRGRRADEPENYPIATPAHYTPESLDPVDGVAIIGCQLHRTQSERELELATALDMLDTLEPVTPLRLYRPASHDDLTMCGACSPTHHPTGLKRLSHSFFSKPKQASPVDNTIAPANSATGVENGTHVTFFSGARDGVRRTSGDNNGQDEARTPSSGPWPGDDKPCSRNLLNNGYILFSDEFTRFLHNTPVGALTDACRASLTTREPSLEVDSSASLRRQRLSEVCHYLSLGEQECRPLFRRRDSAYVYGRASYNTPRET